jgi:Uncharacterized protein conserved in bacteria (DUF2252)
VRSHQGILCATRTVGGGLGDGSAADRIGRCPAVIGPCPGRRCPVRRRRDRPRSVITLGEVGETTDLSSTSGLAEPGRRLSPTDRVASLEELRRHARALRSTLPRGELATLTLPERDPLAILEQQNGDRLQDLVPVRIGRMLQSPFAYYRGTAAVMTSTTSTRPRTHLGNGTSSASPPASSSVGATTASPRRGAGRSPRRRWVCTVRCCASCSR